ncbi:hypothetical protein [Aeoliella mucimassa]|uniref:Uncharacterized protein n=1 Tax=Aeoliella mucimassa TaxID=2527972 RepID=A0A518ANA4_9BACT|nr:hypothetical protein [Aeoliella mucimassa]QDU56212.1 hypothetical protein Pan181_24200 [Aeoliella mucimassa]
MTKHNAYEGDPSLESLIRSAGDYVQPSEGLRPQVIEAVRDAKGDRRDRSRVMHSMMFAAAVFLVGLSLPWWQPNFALRGPTSMDEVLTSGNGTTNYRNNDLGWRLVEIFTDVREQQAKSLNQKATAPPNDID